MTLASGARMGVYEIVAPLGAGGMGEVYRAHDTKLGRSVAVKILPDALVADPDRVARFEREAKVLASLNHPHIAVLYGSEEDAGRHFLVMELVEGETLDARLKPRALSIDEALAIARQIADALEAAHERGIVHRDLKPANIKITTDDNVKVLDFGLAKAVGVEPAASDSGAAGLTHSPTLTFAGATQAGMILGTAPYMSPEQAKGRAADKRSDVWAFGCVLYEMLAGRRAFEGDDVSEVLASVIKGDPDWTALPAKLPPAIDALIRGCLKKERKDRIGDISTALFLLNQPRALASNPAVNMPAPALWRRALPLAAAITIGAALDALWSSRPTPSTPPAVARFMMTVSPGRLLSLPRQAVTISPDGSRIAYVADGRIYVRSLSDLEPRAIAGVESAMAPVFSPDGQSLAFWAPSALKRVAVAGGPATTICQVPVTPSGVEWSQNGILFAQAGSGILRVSPNGGTPEVVIPTRATQELIHGPQTLPGGFVLFTVTERRGTDFVWDQARVVVQSLTTGEQKTLVENASDGRYLATGHLVYAVAGTLLAVPFDVRNIAVTGNAVPIVEGVARATSITGGTAQFAVSASGTLVYLPGPASGGRQDVMLFDRTGGAESLKLPPGSYAYPRVSPDGKRLALETIDGKETNVSIYDLSGTTSVRRLTFGGNNRYPIWSADGTRVTFQSDRDGERAIFWQPADGGPVERLTKPDAGTVHTPESWSRSDNLLFSVAKGSEVSLWMLSGRDRKSAPFSDVRSSTLATDAAFSPDDRWVAYQIAQPGEGEGTTYVEPFPPNGTKYQIARGGRPAWSRDGTELFYVPAPGQFMSVKISTRPSFAFSTPTAVPRGFGIADPINPRPYDILPDGRIVGVGSAAQTNGAGPAQIQVVLNWTEELKARVPR